MSTPEAVLSASQLHQDAAKNNLYDETVSWPTWEFSYPYPGLLYVPVLDEWLDELNQVMLNLIVNAADAIVEKLGEGSDDNGTRKF